MSPEKSFLFLFLSSFSILHAIAQRDSAIVQKTNEQTLEFYGDAFLTSNAIKNDFIVTYYRGKFLDNELKKNSSEHLSRSNRLGGASKIGFTYSYHSLQGNNKAVFSFSFYDRQNLDVRFSDDLFRTVFYGNKSFVGETAHLGNCRFNFLHYQQFRFGWKWTGDARHGSYGFAFSLLSGEQNTFIKADKANLYTSPDGQFIDLALAMQVQQTDTAHKNYFAQNGMGLSTDFFYELPYIIWRKKGKITFEVNDFGFIRWNSNSTTHSVDSSYHYEGVNVNNILNTSTGAIPKWNTDSIINKNSLSESKQYTTNLPFYFNVRTRTWYGKQFSFEKGISFLFNSSAKPYYFLKLHFSTRKQKAEFAYTLGYGGYGKFNSGVEARVDFSKHYSLCIADNYLFSSVNPQMANGMGVYLKLVRRF
ncbi:MAG: hypothetical protein HY840_06225 [Bacteroidetes bacterium]|nr:hypothetical protein [Bacteroidota bacterium]